MPGTSAHPPRAVLALLVGDGSLEVERRVMFVNLDAWHASGVEEAFYTTDRVLSISLHRRADGFFPGSGGVADCGEESGKHHTINLPVSSGLNDADLSDLVVPVITAAAERFCPHAIVCCTGAGMIAGDRLGCLNATPAGQASCLKALMALDVPLLVLGGGGFTPLNAARAWCHATATLCGVELDGTVPEHSCSEYYAPDYQLAVPLATMEDTNAPEELEKLREGALSTIREMPARSKPLSARRPPTEGGAFAAGGAEGGAGGATTACLADGATNGGVYSGSGMCGGGEAGGAPPNGAVHESSGASAGAAADGMGGAAKGDAMDVDEQEATGTTADEGGGRIPDGMVAEEPAIGDND